MWIRYRWNAVIAGFTWTSWEEAKIMMPKVNIGGKIEDMMEHSGGEIEGVK